MNSVGYSELIDRLGTAAASFAAGSQRVAVEWNDSLGSVAVERLGEAAVHGERVAEAVATQAEEHERLGGLVELVDQHAEAVRGRVAASSEAVASASDELDRAADLGDEARAAVSASGTSVDQALRLASLAGVECGKAVSFGEFEGLVQQHVVRARKAEVARMAAREAAREAAEQVVEEAAQHVLGVPEGAIPEHLVEQAKSSVHSAGEITAARVRGFLDRVRGG